MPALALHPHTLNTVRVTGNAVITLTLPMAAVTPCSQQMAIPGESQTDEQLHFEGSTAELAEHTVGSGSSAPPTSEDGSQAATVPGRSTLSAKRGGCRACLSWCP